MASYEARGPPVKPAAPFVSLLRRRPRDPQEHPDGLVLLDDPADMQTATRRFVAKQHPAQEPLRRATSKLLSRAQDPGISGLHDGLRSLESNLRGQ